MIINDFWNKWNRDIIYIISILILCCICLFSINTCSKEKDKNTNNIVALTDSVKYYQTKNGELVASKTLLEGSVSDLKIANNELYNKLKNMKVSNPSSAVLIKNVVENKSRDTIWTVTKSDLEKDTLVKDFEFIDEHRELTGNIWKKDTTMGINVNKDIIKFDYTVAVKDDKVYISSSNPYVKYNSVSGYIKQNEKIKRWSLGPGILGGYDPFTKKFSGIIGIGITYSLIRW
jgi:hypothetical protein